MELDLLEKSKFKKENQRKRKLEVTRERMKTRMMKKSGKGCRKLAGMEKVIRDRRRVERSRKMEMMRMREMRRRKRRAGVRDLEVREMKAWVGIWVLDR